MKVTNFNDISAYFVHSYNFKNKNANEKVITTCYGEEITAMISKENIIVKKQIPYDQIWEILRNSSIGVIPFRKNPLTENNTPTKLFEIFSNSTSCDTCKALSNFFLSKLLLSKKVMLFFIVSLNI